jgi:hypothetical protein
MAAPTITPIEPVSGATNVVKTKAVVFTAVDPALGVALATIQAWVRGVLVLQNGINADPNWKVEIAVITDGFRVTLTPFRLAYYRNLEIVGIRAYAEDTATNATNLAWSFTSERSSTLKTYSMLTAGIRKLDEE